MWKQLPYKPLFQEFHPCIHRWMEANIPNLPPKKLRYILKQTSKRTEVLAVPLLRRLLTLWLLHSETLPSDKRQKILQMLLDNGFTMEQLEKMKMEEQRRKEIMRMKAEAGPFDVFDNEGNIITGKVQKKRGKNKSNKGKKKKTKDKPKKKKSKKLRKKTIKKKGKVLKNKSKKKKRKSKIEEADEYEGFKAGKSGQLGPGWPNYIGLQLMALMWKLEESPPDETFISRAQAYFNIQAETLLKIITRSEKPQLEDVNKCLNLTVWIAQNVIAPAKEIPDDDVDKLLQLRGGELKIKKKKGKKQKPNVEEKKNVVDEPQRRWTEQAYPKINPKKKRSNIPPDMPKTMSQTSIKSYNIMNGVDQSVSETDSLHGLKLSTDKETLFLNSVKWYDPNNPEFIYGGPHIKPMNMNFIDENNESKWILASADMSPQPLQPNPVAILCPELRPIIHSGGTNGISENESWFIVSDLEFYNEKKSKEFYTSSVQEQLEMICRLVKTVTHVSKISITRFLELIDELCEAIELSMKNETATPKQQLIDEKRTIILEKYFIKFFGSRFRDYNNNTPNYMRTICKQGAVLIRYLYDNTAIELWNKQQHRLPDVPEEVEDEIMVSESDPTDIVEWEEWLQYLSRSSDTAKKWQKWLQSEIENNELPENRTLLLKEAEDWLTVGENIRLESHKFSDTAQIVNSLHGTNSNNSHDNPDSIDEDDWCSEETNGQ